MSGRAAADSAILAELAALRADLRALAVYLARLDREAREEQERRPVGRHAPWRVVADAAGES